MSEENETQGVECSIRDINIEVAKVGARNFLLTTSTSFFPIFIKTLLITFIPRMTEVKDIYSDGFWENFIVISTTETTALAILVVVGLRSFILSFFTFIDFQSENAQLYYSSTQVSRRLFTGLLGLTIGCCICYYIYLETIAVLDLSLPIGRNNHPIFPFLVLVGLYFSEIILISVIESSNKVLIRLNAHNSEAE